MVSFLLPKCQHEYKHLHLTEGHTDSSAKHTKLFLNILVSEGCLQFSKR